MLDLFGTIPREWAGDFNFMGVGMTQAGGVRILKGLAGVKADHAHLIDF